MNVHRIVASASAVALVATVALAQGRHHRDEVRIHLKSTNYRYSSKDARNVGVRLVRQSSKSPCIEGRSWGYNGRKIWVDKGCEGDFAYVPR